METVGEVLDRFEAREAMALQLRPDGNSLDFLQLIYRNSSLPLPTRMRAAMACLPHEVPKLMATAIIDEQDFATLLDRRLARMAEQKLIEARPTPPVEVKPPLPRLPDRRFRRI